MPAPTSSPSDSALLALQRELAATQQELEKTRAALAATNASRRESQVYFEKSFYSSPAVMSIARAADGKIIEANPAFLLTSGLTREEVMGRTTADLGVWVRPNQRDEFIAQIRANGVIRDYEATFRTKFNTVFTLILNADLIELGGEPCILNVGIDITERKRRSQVQSATYEISQAVLGGDDLPTLLGKVHRIIAGLMPARNLYVALLTPDRTKLAFPYFADETVPHPEPRALRNGITEYVLDSGQALLARDPDIVSILKSRGEYRTAGNPCAQWMGAPLKVDGRSIGVIALQDYHNANAYTEEDKQLLLFVADQTATAIYRQQVEAAQRDARAYFEKSFHGSSALMSIGRLSDGKIIEINPSFLRASGYTRDEVVGRTTAELNVWQHASQREEFFALFAKRGSIRDFFVNFRSKDGRLHTLLLNADLVVLAGEPCMLNVGIDITERRRRDQVQAATYEISQLVVGRGDLTELFTEVHRIISGLMPAKNLYVALLNDDGTQLSFPYFVDEYVPAPPPRMPGNGFTEYVLAAGRTILATAEELPDLLRSRGLYQPLERPAAQRLGTPLLLEGRAIGVIALQDYNNSSAYGPEERELLSFVAEQTAATVQRRRAEAARARAEANYRSIFENALEGLFLSSADGRFLRVNPALARMCGYSDPAAMIAATNDIGRQFYVNPRRRPEFFELVQTRDAIIDFESEIYRADGSTFWASESVRVVRNATGGVDHFEGVAVDITQRHEARRILQAAKDAADTASRAKSRFLASVSHELRTPLNGILGYTQILRRDVALGEKQRDGVRVIHESADHLLALINDLLDLSKIEAGRLDLHATDFDLSAFALAAARVFAPRAREKNLHLETELTPELPRFVQGDEQRLRQIIFNLLANAVKFTAHGGVVFSIQSIPPSSDAKPAPGEIRLRFSISDTGPGIAPENLERIFEPFTQVGDLARNVTGTGLGLAISRSLVEQFGGKLHVESRLGWGSRFWFELPVLVAEADPTTGAQDTSRRILGYDGPRRRILVVDDNATNRAVMVNLLAPLGFEIAEASDGLGSLEQATAFLPDLILMDLRLPGAIDGLEATRRLRAQPIFKDLRVIAVSASAFYLDRDDCFTAGCDAFLAKPFREEELWGAVERALGLTWQYSAPGTGGSSSPFPRVVHAPAPAELAALFDLATKGDVVGIRTRAQALLTSDPELGPFAQSILDLAARFKMKAIRQFLARYLPPS